MAKVYLDIEHKLNKNDFIVSKTDRRGIITYCNRIFMDLAKYEEEELLGQPHSIIRHQDMPKAVFKLLWKEIKNSNEVFAYVKNRCKDGSYYWVYTNVTPSYDSKGSIIGYYSVRRRPNVNALNTIKEIYAKMISIEASDGEDESLKYLLNIVAEHGMEYNELIIHLQNNS